MVLFQGRMWQFSKLNLNDKIGEYVSDKLKNKTKEDNLDTLIAIQNNNKSKGGTSNHNRKIYVPW